jgi:hypothetical protein
MELARTGDVEITTMALFQVCPYFMDLRSADG